MRRQAWLLMAVLGASALVGSAVANPASAVSGDAAQSAPKVVAVLDLQDLGPSVELEPLRKGLAQMLAADLARRGDVVISRQWAQPLVQERNLLQSGVTDGSISSAVVVPAWIISGKFRANTDGIDLTVEIVHMAANRRETAAQPLGVKSFHAQPEDVFNLEHEVLQFAIECLGVPEEALVSASAGSGSTTVAVMDVRNYSATGRLDPYQEFFTDEMSSQLARSPGVAVVERGRIREVVAEIARGLAGSDMVDMRQLGNLLAADRIVVTTMVEAGGAVRFDALAVERHSGIIAAAVTRFGQAEKFKDVMSSLASDLAKAVLQPAPAPPTPPAETPVAAALTTTAEKPAATGSAPPSVSSEAKMHVDKGIGFFDKSRFDLAVDEYYQAVHAAPDWPRAWTLLAQALTRLTRFEESAEAYHRAYTVFHAAGNDRDARFCLELALHQYMHAGQYGKALPLSNDLLSVAPAAESVHAALIRACVLAFNNQLSEAMAIGERYVQQGDSNGAYRVFAAIRHNWFCDDANPDPLSSEERLVVAQRELEVFPEQDGPNLNANDNALFGLCSDMETADDVDGTLARFRAAAERLRANPALARVLRIESAGVLSQAGRYEEAAQAYEMCIAEFGAETEMDMWAGIKLAGIYAERLHKPQRAIEVYTLVVTSVAPATHLYEVCVKALKDLGAALPSGASRANATVRFHQNPVDSALSHLVESWGYRVEGLPWRAAAVFGDADIECFHAGVHAPYTDNDIERLRHHLYCGGRALVFVDVISNRTDELHLSPTWLLEPLGIGFAEDPQQRSMSPVMATLTGHPLAGRMGDLGWQHNWWGLKAPDDWIVARLGGEPVIAAGKFGLGRVVVVGLGGGPQEFSLLTQRRSRPPRRTRSGWSAHSSS